MLHTRYPGNVERIVNNDDVMQPVPVYRASIILVHVASLSTTAVYRSINKDTFGFVV